MLTKSIEEQMFSFVMKHIEQNGSAVIDIFTLKLRSQGQISVASADS